MNTRNKRKLPASLREGANEVAAKLRSAGYEAYFAGGCVRDRLLGLSPKDYDVVSNATPEQIMKVFRRTIPVGAAFGVVRVWLGKGFEYEVATYRTDGDYSDGRRPDRVEYSTSKEEDVTRRDFTINALLMDPQTDRIIDVVGGQQDLEAKRIRAVGDPAKRVAEDRLRMLRAVRFAARLGFEIEPTTYAAIMAHAPEIVEVSVERIVIELDGIFGSARPAHGLGLLVQTDLLRHVLPFERPPIDEMKAAFERLPEAHEDKEARAQIAWALLLRGLPKDALEQQLRQLKLSKEQMRTLTTLVRATEVISAPERAREADVVRLLVDPQAALIAAYQAVLLGEHPAVAQLQEARAALQERPLPALPLVTGADLKALGLSPGPRFKEILAAVEIEVFERRLQDSEAALSWVRARFLSSPP